MISNNGENDETDGEEEISSDEDKMPDIGGDTIVDVSGELKVDELVAKVESGDPDEAAKKRAVRKQLEEIDDKRDKELDSTYNFNLDDEL